MFLELHVLSLLLYGITTLSVAVPLLGVSRAPASPQLLLSISFTSIAVHFVALLAYARALGVIPLAGAAAPVSSLGFMIGFLAVAIQWLTRESAIQLVAGPIAATLVAAAILVGFGGAPGEAGGREVLFIFHAGGSLLGLAFLVVAFAASALYLAQHRELKGRSFGAMFQLLPSLDQLDRLNHLALLVGFPTLTIGVLLGIGSTVGEIGGVLNFFSGDSAHFGWGVTAWAVIGGISVGRVFGWLRGRRAAFASIGGLAAIVIAYFAVVGLGGAGPPEVLRLAQPTLAV